VKLDYKIHHRKDRKGVDLICDNLPYGKLWYGEPNAVENAVSYAHFNAGARAAAITIFDEAGEVIDRGIEDPPDRAGFDVTGHRHKREQFSESSSNERAPGCRGI